MSSELHLGLVKLGTMFPLEEDLISANAGDDRRVQQLRQLLLSQLDLIQKQSEAIVTKDNHIKELKRENESLKKKVTSLEKSATSKKTVKEESTTTNTLKQEEIKQELEQSNDSIDNDDSADSEDVCMETVEPYFTLVHGFAGAVNEDDIEMQKKAEVPGWRIKPISASYIMEGTENVEDSNLLKRHQKPENDEKRRKRWDVQRIREQRHVARLRARYDPSGDAEQSSSALINNANLNLKLIPEASKESLDIKTLLPNPEEATDILVQETIPVSVFGSVLPKLNSKDFSLPWIN